MFIIFLFLRFAMAYEDYNPINTEIGFLALDPDRVHEDMTGGSFTDLGEDYDLSGKSDDICPTMLEFLNSTV